MEMSSEAYRRFAAARAERSPLGKDCLRSFVTGGGICVLGQAVGGLWRAAGAGEAEAGTLTTITLIALSVLLTGLGLYSRLAQFGGAGTLVPVTGFANAVASPAIDSRREGIVTGTAARMFTVAGPVLVFGTAASAVYGLVLWLLR